MRLSITTILKCNAVLNNTIKTYDLFSRVTNDVRCERELLRICGQELNKPISILEICDSKKDKVVTIKGDYIALKDSYAICLVEDLNQCWKRFVICKELFHVLFDNPEFENMDLSSHIEDCVSDTPVVDDSPQAVQSEYLAEYAAMEFLFPYTHRLGLINAGKSINYLDIATHYRIPQIYVERYLTEHMMKLASIITQMG